MFAARSLLALSSSLFIVPLTLFLSVLLLIFFRERISEFLQRLRKSESKEKCLESQPPPEISKLHARILLITCAAMYGSNFVGTKILQQTLAPSMITTLRFLIGSLFFVRQLSNFRGDMAIIKGGFELGIWTASGFLVQAITLQYTTANKNAFLCALSVVMIPVLDSMMCCFTSKYCRLCPAHVPHPPTKSNHLHGVLIPAVFSVSGILALEYGGLDPPSSIDAIVLLAPICFAMGLWRTEQIAAQYPNDTVVITGTLLLTTTSICFTYSLLSGEFPMSLSDLSLASSTILLDWKVLCGLLYSGICMTAWSSYAEQCSLKVLTAAETTVIYSLEPLFAAALSSIFLHEYFGFNSMVGAFCIILACLWNSLIVPTLSQHLPFFPISENQSVNDDKAIV